MTIEGKEVCIVTVKDPDSNLDVDVQIIKEEGGAMIGVDASYLEQDVGPVISPVGNGLVSRSE